MLRNTKILVLLILTVISPHKSSAISANTPTFKRDILQVTVHALTADSYACKIEALKFKKKRQSHKFSDGSNNISHDVKYAKKLHN